MPLVHRETVDEQGVEAVLLDVGDCHVELLRPLGPRHPGRQVPRQARRGPSPRRLPGRRHRRDARASSSERGVELIDSEAADRDPHEPGRLPAPEGDRRRADRARRAGGRPTSDLERQSMAEDDEAHRDRVRRRPGVERPPRRAQASRGAAPGAHVQRQAGERGGGWYDLEIRGRHDLARPAARSSSSASPPRPHTIGFSGSYEEGCRAGLRRAVGAAALWWRKNPSACPYGQRFWVEAPHPLITRDRLREIARACSPASGARDRSRHRLLHARPRRLGRRPRGALEIFDLQQEMLDHTIAPRRRARARERQPPRAATPRTLPLRRRRASTPSS